MEWYKRKKDSTIIKVTISIGKIDRIVGVIDDRLRIKISEPPKQNRANDRLIEFISCILKTPKSQIKIDKGLKNKNKTILIDSIV